VIARGEALRAAGLEPALHRRLDAVNAYWIDARQCRHALRLMEDGRIRAVPPEGAAAESDEPALPVREWLARLDADPARFGTNVVTRPLAQDAILPTVAQVAGPGEAAYLAQVEAAYEDFGVFAPVRWPRPQALLIEPRVARQLEKYGLTLEEARGPDERALMRRAGELDAQTGPLHELESLRRRQREELEQWRARAAGGDPAIMAAVAKLIQMMDKGYETLADRLMYRQQRDGHHLAQAMALLANSLAPAGQPQERLMNPLIPFAVNMGLDWARGLLERLSSDPCSTEHLIELGKD
jgi:uncharacterized protein YllA (UPF0747 family)